MQPVNSILLQLDRPLQDVIEHGTLKLYLNPDYNPENWTTVSGTVAALPKHPKGEHKAVVNQLKEGDEVVFSYSIVANRKFADLSNGFTELSDNSNPHYQRHINGKGEKLNILAFMGVITKQWAGYYLDKNGELIDGFQGSEHDMERWKSQFDFGGNHTYTFKNLIEINGKDYWQATDYSNIFAKNVNGELVAVGDRCILQPIDIDVTEQMKIMNGIHLPDNRVQARLYDRAILISGGEEMGLQKGDCVSFESKYCEKYFINNKQYFILKKRRILGVWSKEQL